MPGRSDHIPAFAVVPSRPVHPGSLRSSRAPASPDGMQGLLDFSPWDEDAARLLPAATASVTGSVPVTRPRAWPALATRARGRLGRFEGEGGGLGPGNPSMRTERAAPQSRCFRTFPHVRGVQLGPLTASECTWQRPAAPIPLPESDTSPGLPGRVGAPCESPTPNTNQ
jgi:hypothetical protein